MRTIMNPKWQAEIEEKLVRGEHIDVTTGINKCAQWLIIRMEQLGRKYTVKNCGAGVKRITGGEL